jgi:hypothetical protein
MMRNRKIPLPDFTGIQKLYGFICFAKYDSDKTSGIGIIPANHSIVEIVRISDSLPGVPSTYQDHNRVNI